MNPIRLVSGAFALPAHAAAAVIGTSVGVAATGARTTVRVVGRVVEQVSGQRPAPSAVRPTDGPPTATEVDPVLGARRSTQAPSTTAAPVEEAPVATAPASVTAPAKKAAAKKAPAKKAPAKNAPAKKAPAKKAAAKKAPSKQAAVLAPALGLSEAEVEAELGTEDDITTPSGIPAAGPGFNPDTTDTDLHQPGTEPLMDPERPRRWRARPRCCVGPLTPTRAEPREGPMSAGRPILGVVHRIFTTSVASVYPHYVAKAERKGRTRAEVDEVIEWLTGFDHAQLRAHLDGGTTFEEFFAAASLNPHVDQITGSVCGVKVQEVEDPLMRQIRYLDKLVDELAKGRPMEKVLRA